MGLFSASVSWSFPSAAPVVVAGFMFAVAMIPLVRRYLDMPRSFAVLLLAAVFSIAAVLYRLSKFEHTPHRPEEVASMLCAGLIYFFALPLLASFARTGLGGAERDVEDQEPRDPLWHYGGDAVCAIGIAVCAWAGYGVPLWTAMPVALAVALGQPLYKNFLEPVLAEPALATHQSTHPHAPAAEDLSHQRDRVLRMLEEGRISAEGCAEVLSALGEAASRGDAPRPLTPARRLILLGAAMVLVGFFLPWYRIDVGREIKRVQEHLGIRAEAGADATAPVELKFNGQDTTRLVVSGGDVSNGLGWITLVLGVTSFVLAFVVKGIDDQTRRTATVAALAAGSIVLIYLVVESPRYVSVGLIIMIAGYVFQWLAALHDRAAATGEALL